MNNKNKQEYPKHYSANFFKLSNGISVEGKEYARMLQDKINKKEYDSYANGHSFITELTKREYFAAKALQGIMSKQSGQGDQLGDLTIKNFDKVAEASVCLADEILKALSQI